ncbi:MAG: hypothetical protein SPE01_13995 [Candidatus Spyradocola sp.]|nr:hypothetical protein [Candidatus Spyradocola sp.]
MRAAWEYVYAALWCANTQLFYDFRPQSTPPGDFAYLPAPAHIAAQTPNPNGWSTGMEDSMLNAGLMASAFAALWTRTRDERLIAPARAVLEGMLRCAESSPREGFLPRSLSPADGHSHYGNASRDQYTNFVWGACRLWDAGLVDDAQKPRLTRALTAFARRMEADVTADNGYELLREDGRPGLCCKMWGDVAPHEALRLPMVYAAAHHVTGDAHWLALCLPLASEGLTRSFAVDCGHDFWHDYAALQMQFSLRLLHDLLPDAAFRARSCELMQRLGQHFEQKAFRIADELLAPGGLTGANFVYKPWHELPARFDGLISGLPYYNHGQSTAPGNAFYALRDLGDAAAVAVLCPGRSPHPDLAQAVRDVSRRIPYEQHATCAPIDLIHAHALCGR